MTKQTTIVVIGSLGLSYILSGPKRPGTNFRLLFHLVWPETYLSRFKIQFYFVCPETSRSQLLNQVSLCLVRNVPILESNFALSDPIIRFPT